MIPSKRLPRKIMDRGRNDAAHDMVALQRYNAPEISGVYRLIFAEHKRTHRMIHGRHTPMLAQVVSKIIHAHLQGI